MAIPKFNFSVKQGNTGTVENPAGLVMTIKDETGTTRDLTGAEIIFFAQWDNAIQLRYSSGAGEVIVDPLEGKVTVPFASTVFRDVSSRKNVRYELELRQNGEQRTVLEGSIAVVAGFNDD
ncbi:MAG: hypothetical protein MK180_12490 [Rhodobacteraceae bacterium]|nr:hypothetical protein [Paracoccaceae bacterium]